MPSPLNGFTMPPAPPVSSRPRADASAQLRSRSACSSRHAARDTRSSTRRSRRYVAVRSAIFMHTACPACTVQQSGHAGGVHGVVLTNTPSPGTNGSTPGDERGSMARDYPRPAAAARALLAATYVHPLVAVLRRVYSLTDPAPLPH